MRRQLARGHICENQHLPDMQYFPYDFRPFSGVTPPQPYPFFWDYVRHLSSPVNHLWIWEQGHREEPVGLPTGHHVQQGGSRSSEGF